jgi:K+-transporting ATPase ATPase A chain
MGGLMVGHTPAYLGKQVTVAEMKLIGLYTIFSAITILPLAAIAISVEAGLVALTTNQGAHGFSEIFYAYSSSFANNGQNFAGLSANSVFYNSTTAIAMLMGRFGLAAVALALAGYFGEQGRRNISSGTLATDTVTFAALLLATTIIIGALSYLPAVALGPVIEHLRLTT